MGSFSWSGRREVVSLLIASRNGRQVYKLYRELELGGRGHRVEVVYIPLEQGKNRAIP